MKIPRLVISGATSGVGKTSIACAIIFGLTKRGYSVQPFKVGPDYIDPSFLSVISGNKARNLDPWIMGKSGLLKNFVRNSTSDISIIEGVMGYYDGFSGKNNYSSTYHVASLLNSPSILILDASKTSRSIAAIATGFKKFHKNSRISGIILNKIGSKKHELLCRQALESVKIPIIGVIPRNESLKLESRHLGLIPTSEQNQIKKITKIAKTMSDFLDYEKIIDICINTKPIKPIPSSKSKHEKITIGVALDNSFNFYYQENLDALRREGAKIIFFSPISDSKIPKCDGLYIGGGFPEILGSKLSKNKSMKNSIKTAAENELPIYAECGGLMYLTKSIHYDNKKFSMVGVIDAQTKMTSKMKLNYTKATFINNCLISNSHKQLHGHEFHYSELDSVPSDSKFAYQLTTGDGIIDKKDGFLVHNVMASYGHLFFDSSTYAKNIISNCLKISRR